jgi:type 1 fimbria pilin
VKTTLSLKKTLALGVATAGLLGASTATASASSTYSFGGDVVTAHCHAWIVSSGNSWNWAVGIVEGDSNCQVQLEQENVNTGGNQSTNWSTNETSALYHNDGVHKLRVWVYDGTSNVMGPGAWVN